MKKFVLLGAVLLLSACGGNSQKQVSIDDYENTYTVNSGSISSNNKYVGVLQSNDNTMLGFKMPGRIIALYVKEGDVVRKGQLLGILDGNEVKTQYKSASDMIASLWNLYKSTESAFNAQISAMQSKIAQAKAGMEGMKTGLGDTQKITKEQLATAEKQVKQAEVGLQTAKTALKNLKKVFAQKENDVYSNSKNSIANSRILLNNFLIFTDQLFGISDENKHKNDAFEAYLSAKNTALKEQIKTDWRKLDNEYKNWKQETDQLLLDIKNSDDVTKDEQLKKRIYDNLVKTKNLLVKSRELADKVYTAIDNSVSSMHFPQTMINQYKKQTTTFQQNIEKTLLTAQGNYLLGVKGSIQAIDNFHKQKSMQLDLAQKKYELAQTQYETAKQTYEQYKAMSEGKVNEVSTKYEIAKKQYEEALQGLQALKQQKQAQLSQIKTQINQVKGNRNLAAVNLGNIKLYAPYDGVITQKMANIGQVVGAGMPVFTIANPKNLKGVFYVPVEEVVNIKKGQQVFVSGLGKTTTGTISVIYPAADMMSKKIPVEVKLSTIPNTWKLGMYITGYPMNNSFKGLVIPQELIHYEYGKAYVYKQGQVENKKGKVKYEKVYIKLGKCDADFCIVKEGLEKGDIIK